MEQSTLSHSYRRFAFKCNLRINKSMAVQNRSKQFASNAWKRATLELKLMAFDRKVMKKKNMTAMATIRWKCLSWANLCAYRTSIDLIQVILIEYIHVYKSLALGKNYIFFFRLCHLEGWFNGSRRSSSAALDVLYSHLTLAYSLSSSFSLSFFFNHIVEWFAFRLQQ